MSNYGVPPSLARPAEPPLFQFGALGPPGSLMGQAPGATPPSFLGLSTDDVSTLGLWTSIAGSSLSLLGNYYNIKSMQSVTQQQAADFVFQASMSNINARAAEFDAAEALAAGRQEGGLIGLQYGQAKGAARASLGGRGVKLGKGSSAEALASIELSKRMDLYTVNSKAVRAQMAGRTQAQNFRTQGALASVSAQNAYGTARGMSRGMAIGGSLLTGASGIAAQWFERSRYSNRQGLGAGR